MIDNMICGQQYFTALISIPDDQLQLVLMAEDLTARKRTMVKTRVGCVKASTYNLPAESHVYGYKQPTDPEGAGARKSQ